MCRQLACFCETSTAASVCLSAQIPIANTLDKCQILQDETSSASQLGAGFDDSLKAVLDIRPLLEASSNASVGLGSRVVLRSTQLVAIARTLQGLMELRDTVLLSEGVNTLV